MPAPVLKVVFFPWSRCVNGSASLGLMDACEENQPPLTTQMTAAPLAFFFGVNTSIVSATPSLRP